MSADTAPSRDPLRRVLAFVGLRPRAVLLPFVLGSAGALSALGLAALSAWLITRAWQMPPVLYLTVAVTGVRALGISRALFRYLERLATHDTALRVMATARERVYRTLAAGDAGYSVGLRRGQLLSRTAADVDDVGNALIRGLIPAGVGAVTSIAAVAIMAVVSVPSALILAVALVVSGVVAPRLAVAGAARSIADGASARDASTAAASTLLWHGPELVVAGRRQEFLDAVVHGDRDAAAATDRGAAWQSAAKAATPLALAVSVLAAALIAVDLSSRVSGSLMDVSSVDGGVTPMLFGVLVLLGLSAFETTGPLTEAGLAIERGRQSARRVMELVDGAQTADESLSESADPVFDPRPVTMTATRLQWGWDEPLGPAEGLSLTLSPGSRTVVVGRSGAGKSTLLLTLAGLRAPLAGELTVTDSGGAASPRTSACYFAEEGHLFSTTLRENLRVARGDATDGEIAAALSDVGLAEWAGALPDGLDTDMAGGAGALSGGQRRRLLLARALLHPAPIVLLDEPTEHLDVDDAAAMTARICDPDGLFGPSRTVVMVTHQHLSEVGAAEVVEVDPAARSDAR